MQDVVGGSTSAWAAEEYGQADLRDARRTSRVVRILDRIMEHRAGKITQVFPISAERKGAYRLLENDDVLPESLIDAAGCACARRSVGYPFVFVPVDGTSATLADPIGALGAIGPDRAGARGIKVISAIALSPTGEPLGVCAQRLWMRRTKAKRRVRGKQQAKAKQHARAKRLQVQKARSCARRPTHQKETQHWIDVIHATKRRFEDYAPTTRCWFQLDREADAWPILLKLAQDRSDDWFTVRAANRRVILVDGSISHLRAVLQDQEAIGGYELDVPPTEKRTARRAHLEIRVAEVVLDLRDKLTNKHHPLKMRVVCAREVGTTPHGEEPLDWLLLTNHTNDTLAQARLVIDGYVQRWKIERVHKTWKSGGCNIEDSQLHTPQAAMKWATILFSVAVRVERINHLARTSPDLPASVELSSYEIRAVLLLKRKYKKRTETVPDVMPTIAQAARWVADLGGYTGKSSGGPFGSITLGRGLSKVVAVAAALESLDETSGGSSGSSG
jgi:transposase-like protein/transposase Tn5 family protein